MDYLTVNELAELKGCSVSYISRLIKNNKIRFESQLNLETNKMRSIVPISALSEDLQAKYYKQKRTETGIMPEKLESENEDKTALKYGLKGIKTPFENFSQKEREEIQQWIELLEEWHGERSRRKDKTEFDKVFVGHQKYINPDLNISESILYRKYSAYKNECYAS